MLSLTRGLLLNQLTQLSSSTCFFPKITIYVDNYCEQNVGAIFTPASLGKENSLPFPKV